MKTLYCRWNFKPWAAILFPLLFLPIPHYAQDACPGLPPPDKDLYLIPNGVLQSYDFTGSGIVFIHDYGNSLLAFLPDTSGMPQDVQARLTALFEPASIHFRDWTGGFVTPQAVDLAGFEAGYHLLAMFGPMETRLLEALRESGLIVMGPLPPNGLLVKADGASMQRALGLCTSFGYRMIREIFPVPEETRLSPILLKMANGEAVDFEASGIVHTPEGGIIVRVLPYPDGCEADTMIHVALILQAAGPEDANGYADAYAIHLDEITPLLHAVDGIAYVEPRILAEPSSNIAMKEDILNIEPVWSHLGYEGRGVVVQVNDFRPKLDLQDFNNGAIFHAKYPEPDESHSYPSIWAHGTHVGGLVAGRGSDAAIGQNMCLCRPRPEESGITPQNNWGDQVTLLPDIRGAAPSAEIAFRDKFESPNNDIFQMMPWGWDNGARISSNSWNTSGGEYETEAWQADLYTRDAFPGTEPDQIGNQEMLHIFSAGNNDYIEGGNDSTPQVWVKNPATAKNVIAVGATENERCGFARNYDCTAWHWDLPALCPPNGCYRCDNKILRSPSAENIYERSGRGLSQHRVKPDIVAVGADVLAAQDPNTMTYYNFECLDCRLPCLDPDCVDKGSTACSYHYDKCDWDDITEYGGKYYCYQDAPSQSDKWLGSCSQRNLSEPHVISSFCADAGGTMIDFDPLRETWTGPYYMTISGTSMAAPIVAGAAAVFHEFYQATKHETPTPALTKAAFINGALDISAVNHKYPFMGESECYLLEDEDGEGEDTDGDGQADTWMDKYSRRTSCTHQGWGRLNLRRSIEGPPGGSIYFIDQHPRRELSTDVGKDSDYEIRFGVTSSTIPLKITLVWTDAVGNETTQTNCSLCLLNDLDLRVTTPNGTVYRGNQFYPVANDTPNYKNWSKPGDTISDTYNNVENVVIKSPQAETWTVEISAATIRQIPEGLTTGQDFALVYSGAVTSWCTSHCRPVTNPSSGDLDTHANTGVLLAWEPPEDWGDGQDASGRTYEIYREGAVIAQDLPYETTTYLDNDPDAPNDRLMRYKINAINSCGTIAEGEEFAAVDDVLGGPFNINPITAVDVDECSKSGVKITWAPPDNWDDTDPTDRRYEVWRSGVAIQPKENGTTEFTDTTGATDRAYLYQVRYINGDDEFSFSSPEPGMDADLDPPGNFSNQSPGNDTDNQPLSPTLDWGDSHDARSYDLYFGTSAEPPLYLGGRGLTQSHYDMQGLEENTEYHWYVKAKNACLPSGRASDVTSFTTGGPCENPILVAESVQADDENYCAYTGIRITFPWNTNWNDGEANRALRQYKILRKRAPRPGEQQIPPYETIATIPYEPCIEHLLTCPSKTYIDASTTIGDAYHYKVRYVNSCRNSAELEVPPNTAPGLSDGAAALPHPDIHSQTEHSNNLCPDLTVPLATDAGKSNYQWYFRDGTTPIAIPGATSATYDADASGAYSVSYSAGPGCIGTSAEFPVTIIVCPFIQYQSSTAPTKIAGDADTVIEAGEVWEVKVYVVNNGQAAAAMVQGSLAGDGMVVFNNPGTFGNIGPGGTGSYVFRFMADPASWYGTYGCGNQKGLHLVNISSDGGSIAYTDMNNFTVITVGMLADEETALIQGDITVPYLQDGQFHTCKKVSFQPEFESMKPVVSATVSYTLIGTNFNTCTLVTLFKGPQGLPLKTCIGNPGTDATAFYNTWDHGVYQLELCRCSGCVSSYTSSNNTMTVVKTAAECDTVMSAYPNEGTTAGGTWVDVYGAADAFASSVETAAKSVGVAGNNNCTSPNIIWLPVGDVDWLDGHHIKIKMPAAVSEGQAAVLIDNDPGTPAVDYCRADSYFYKTLAFTANRDSRDITIVDTVDNAAFAPTSAIAMPGVFAMLNMAYDQGTYPGRTLFLPDELTGDLAFVDAANFTLQRILNAQEPNIYARVLQPDIAVAPDGDYAFVSYLTKGYPIGVPTPDNPESGGVEVIGLTATACEGLPFPCVYDIDHNAGTTSPGAPSGISRLHADSPYFYPLDIVIVDLRRPNIASYAEGEKYPGVYAFISAVGELVTDCLNPPDCTEYEIRPRPAVIGIIDLNPSICTLDAGKPCGRQTVNTDYWKQSHKILAPIVIGQDGEGLGDINQGMDFAANFAASPVPNATVYAVNPTENAVYRIKYMYNPATHSVSWERLDPAIGGFSTPTDVKVQKVGTATYAYITNAGNDRVTVVNTATDTVTGEPFKQDQCSAVDHYPTAMDARSRATAAGAHHGYSADYHTAAISVYDLLTQTMNAPVCEIPVGQAPIRLVVQPVPGSGTFFESVRTELAFAPPGDFETPSKQHILISDWERVKELEDTNADPQAVLANIDNFQRSVNSWTTDETVRNDVNKGADLYRAAYLLDHPPAGNP